MNPGSLLVDFWPWRSLHCLNALVEIVMLVYHERKKEEMWLSGLYDQL